MGWSISNKRSRRRNHSTVVFRTPLPHALPVCWCEPTNPIRFGLFLPYDSMAKAPIHAARERDLRLAVRELEFLQRLSLSAASTVGSDELLDLIIRETTSAIGTDVCSLYLLVEGGQELVL